MNLLDKKDLVCSQEDRFARIENNIEGLDKRLSVIEKMAEDIKKILWVAITGLIISAGNVILNFNTEGGVTLPEIRIELQKDAIDRIINK